MSDIYIYLLLALGLLAIADLVVGVSNDAVNFLNSAIGSKVVSFRLIMIVASLGVALGAVASSGMMEIARSGIFIPGEFYFNEIMIICMAVMIGDILLLDFFNSMGMPTSTTVSIVFNLLGAAVAVSLLKIYHADDNFSTLGNYINSKKALEIITGILLSVFIAFAVGAIVQFITRFFMRFDFDKRPRWTPALFGGMGITAIFYFIVIKGLKGSPVMPEAFKSWVDTNFWAFLLLSTAFWSLVTYMQQQLFKVNAYKLIIVLGTFALAMAFAGNDLVNFVGVPIAAWQGYEAWAASGVAADQFTMESLGEKVAAPTYLLLFSGLVMVLTLWFSEKAHRVVKTSVDLSRQDEGRERFRSNTLSRGLVRGSILINRAMTVAIPNRAVHVIEKRFAKPQRQQIDQKLELPAFDMIRAAVNLMVAALLISFATSLKLPLSTTYVTFMVAMGTSLADRAWGSDSAVYRVAGVLNVIGGWFMTALAAFVTASILALIIYSLGEMSLIALFAGAFFMIIRTYLKGKRAAREFKEEEQFKKAESASLQGVIEESSGNVSTIMKRSGKVYAAILDGLAKQKRKKLKKARKATGKLYDEVEELKEHVFYYIKNLDGHEAGASRFYLMVQDLLHDLASSLELISKAGLKHVKNNHRALKFNQIKDLKEIEEMLLDLFKRTKEAFDDTNLDGLAVLLNDKQELFGHVSGRIEKQIKRAKAPDASSKNTTLYFTILLETKDLISSTMELMELYYSEYKKALIRQDPLGVEAPHVE